MLVYRIEFSLKTGESLSKELETFIRDTFDGRVYGGDIKPALYGSVTNEKSISMVFNVVFYPKKATMYSVSPLPDNVSRNFLSELVVRLFSTYKGDKKDIITKVSMLEKEHPDLNAMADYASKMAQDGPDSVKVSILESSEQVDK